MKPGLLILISGRGSNALAILDAIEAGVVPAELRAVVADRPCAGLERVAARGIDTALIPRTAFKQRDDFERALSETIAGYSPELIVLAGFMRVLSAGFVERHAGRMINIHPSLLPKYRGLDTHARALAAGDSLHGASVHWVTAELDGGPVIARAEVEIRPGDDAERLAARVLAQEHRLYPAALALLLADVVSSGHEIDPKSEILVLDRDLDDRGRRIG
ncbi:MAG: phosphoribosylglycinamide formyltransferase [Gammaproteobacteria bacterium HGW-Gammaproteobacteria-8]|nr:MAG: phosphoribosylglycinamide formyltransferase [Gammaproteobacteria bacterium HGW-Gammaproteobacteria-8]